jgi:acetyl esterase/lipase
VVLFPAVPYGPKPRHLIDIYIPSSVYEQLQQEQQPQQQLAPVVFFCHGGIWATGGS